MGDRSHGSPGIRAQSLFNRGTNFASGGLPKLLQVPGDTSSLAGYHQESLIAGNARSSGWPAGRASLLLGHKVPVFVKGAEPGEIPPRPPKISTWRQPVHADIQNKGQYHKGGIFRKVWVKAAAAGSPATATL